MSYPTRIALALACLTLAAAPPVHADVFIALELTPPHGIEGSQGVPHKVEQILTDCTNYGNQVNIGGVQTCQAGTDCANYGNQVEVATEYDCDGSCPNYGVRVQLDSDVCGDRQDQVCKGSTCVTPGLVWSDCLPEAFLGPGATIYVGCDPSGQPCGIDQMPICWTVRYACMNALVSVLNVYDHVRQSQTGSSCEGQPGWS